MCAETNINFTFRSAVKLRLYLSSSQCSFPSSNQSSAEFGSSSTAVPRTSRASFNLFCFFKKSEVSKAVEADDLHPSWRACKHFSASYWCPSIIWALAMHSIMSRFPGSLFRICNKSIHTVNWGYVSHFREFYMFYPKKYVSKKYQYNFIYRVLLYRKVFYTGFFNRFDCYSNKFFLYLSQVTPVQELLEPYIINPI